MNRKLVFVLTLTLLFGILSVALDIQMANASGTVHILADGCIDPPTAPIQRAGDLYTFSSDISASNSETNDILIAVYRSNIIVDGNGSIDRLSLGEVINTLE